MTTSQGTRRRAYDGFDGEIGRTFSESTPSWPAETSARPGSPNIILMLADDLGYSDVGCFGGEIPTPNLNAIADQGIRYTNFHATPKCSTTRASLMTGVDHHLAGFADVVHVDPGYPNYRMELGVAPIYSDNQDEKAEVARLGREGVARASKARGGGAQTLDRYRSRILVQMRSFDVRVDFGDGYRPTDEGVLIAQGDQGGGYLLYVEDGHLHFCHNYGGRTRAFDMGALGPHLDQIGIAFVARPEGVCSVRIAVHGEVREVPAQFNLFSGITPFQGIDVGIDRRSPVSRELRSRRGTFAYSGALRSVTITPGQRLSEMLQSSRSRVDEEHNRLAERLDD